MFRTLSLSKQGLSTVGVKCAAVLGSLALLVSVAACGTTDTNTSGSAATASASGASSADPQGYDTSAVTKDPEIAAMLPESITKDGKLTIGADTSYAPGEFLAADGKTPIGFDVDLSRAIAAIFGLKEVTVTSTLDSVIPAVGSKYDIGLSSLTMTPQRMDAVEFVTYFKAGSTYVVKKGNPKGIDPEHLCGQKVAIQTGSTQEELINQANAKCKAEGKDPMQIQSSKMQTDVTTAVATGKADIFYSDTPVAGYAIKQTGDVLQSIGQDVGVTPEAVAIKKGDMATAKAVQRAIQKLMDDGTYKKILDTWGVSSGAIDKAEINPRLD
ncbi:ABC transporter substrate-binding protein [Bifidobacterium mongoliense]|jgi:polar amino acid transport system substrate-binding protein|uniref:ABC transporter substrate-binding protein n=2 Tax=Bifidobacterium mongoliense TaxID=518643 RepID=A0A087BSG2_9BIFI|nr:ABC transporter substrate-binding protein [Bifidobacterium mongoliense]KFI73962.1 ABC transporter substrate-binding protein [Bifidobacterium mongoliense DSM 21395]MDN6051009.1 ABC transporter substrate-binding protein [Bifidobacterium mongoliense]MDN6768752.1 ABC transporter substrate-binding protein [Bifidobacterium mongoliense]MDN6802738.1 ABC transporter substrate-binding protein [Bifidobacterium mongoliense]